MHLGNESNATMSIKLIPIAALALFLAPASLANPTIASPATAIVIDGGDSDEPDCPGTGAEWVPAKIVASGGIQCPSAKFKISVGNDQAGGQITIEYNGCPSYVDIAPGHGKKIEKEHFRAVGPQKIHWTRQEYKADCGGWFSGPSCTPKDGPMDLDTTEDHWIEEACDN